MSPAARQRTAGFSLLELLVALSIMSMALGLLYQASTGSMRAVGDLDADQRAGVLAQSILEARDSVPAAGWNESGGAAQMRWQVRSGPYDTAIGRELPTVTRLHEVRVLVEWDSRRGPQRLELHTLLPQQRPQPGETQ